MCFFFCNPINYELVEIRIPNRIGKQRKKDDFEKNVGSPGWVPMLDDFPGGGMGGYAKYSAAEFTVFPRTSVPDGGYGILLK